jgi:hypothetical protein
VIERWCSWCVPPRLIERIDDGKAATVKTHGICPLCYQREMYKITGEVEEVEK